MLGSDLYKLSHARIFKVMPNLIPFFLTFVSQRVIPTGCDPFDTKVEALKVYFLDYENLCGLDECLSACLPCIVHTSMIKKI